MAPLTPSPSDRDGHHPARLDLTLGGRWDPVAGTVVGGTLVETTTLRPPPGEHVVIGRGRSCDVIVPEATRHLSREAVAVGWSGANLVAWVRSASGGTVHLPDGIDLDVPARTDEDPDPRPRELVVRDRTVVELPIAPGRTAFLCFRVPVSLTLKPPPLQGLATDPESSGMGRAAYGLLSAADRDLLAAIACDLVATPAFGIAVPSKPSQVVVMLQQESAAFFATRRKDAGDYTEANLAGAITSMVKRIDVLEATALVAEAARIANVCTAWVEAGHAATAGIFEWVKLHPEVLAELDFERARAMQAARTEKIRRDRDAQVRHGQEGGLRRRVGRPAPISAGRSS